jgi:hypothetical protein
MRRTAPAQGARVDQIAQVPTARHGARLDPMRIGGEDPEPSSGEAITSPRLKAVR